MSLAAVAFKLPAPDSDFEEWEGLGVVDTVGDSGSDHAIGCDEAGRSRVSRLLQQQEERGGKASLDTLRLQVATVVAGNHSAGPAWPTGITGLDVALGGGVPRGRVTEVVGTVGAGKTSLVRQLVARVLVEGGWVAWVDATRTLAPQELAGLGERLIMVRPRDHTRGAWCADLLLRSGVFALVVLDGAPVLSRVVGVRLSQLARERDAAFVVLREGTQASRLGGAVRLQVKAQVHAQTQSHAHPTRVVRFQSRHQAPTPLYPNADQQHVNQQQRPPSHDAVQHRNATKRNYSVLVEKGGSYRTVEVHCAIVLARRVCADTEIPDRRGVARGTRAAAHDSGEQNEQHHDSEHATIAVAGQQLLQHFARKGRGRARAAESGYGRFTRRGEARKFLRAREQYAQQ
jgi:hypothetical protein